MTSESEEELSNEEEDVAKYHDNQNEDGVCSICLNEFRGQQIGVPEACKHVFCVDCILQWSKVSCSCPADRITFSFIDVYKTIGGKYCRKVIVKSKETAEEEEEDTTVCEICGSGNNEDTLLLCDGCDKGYHCACLRPSLAAVPQEEWFCNRCQPRQRAQQGSSRNQRTVGRTRATERVRNRISQNRMQHSSFSNLNEQLDAIIDNILAEGGSRFEIVSSAGTRRQSRPRSRKRRATKRKISKRRKGKTKTKKSKKSRNDDNNLPSTSANNELRNPVPLPGAALSIMGGADDLDEYYANDVEEVIPSYKLAQQHRRLTQSALVFNKPLPSLFATSIRPKRRKVHKETTPPPAQADLLASILGSQELLMTPSAEIQIGKGGKLKLAKKTR